MGTSASNTGPGKGVPLVPPWVPDETTNTDEVPKAPTARFREARRALNSFAKNGGSQSLSKGLRGYANQGLGGSNIAARRMGGAATRSGALFNVLQNLSFPTDNNESRLDPESLVGMSSQEAIDTIIGLVSPIDGSQDSESSQHSIASALSDLLEDSPDADLASLSTDQIYWVLERHLAHEISNRVELDIGGTIMDNAPSATVAVERLEEVREYIQEAVASVFRSRSITPMTQVEATDMANDIIEEVFAVFEEYTEE